MVNEKLKTTNEILKALNESYFVCKAYNGEKGEYDVYANDDKCGRQFVCRVIVSNTAKKSVIYNGVKYTNTEKWINEVNKFNDSLFFPADCYDPNFRKSCKEEQKINWYLTKVLKMKRGSWEDGARDEYIMRNVYGDPILTISYRMDYNYGANEEDTGSGLIYSGLNGGSFISPTFKDAEEAVNIINTIIGVESIVNLNNSMEVLTNLKGGFDDMKNVKVETFETVLYGGGQKYKDKVIPILENLLKKLKETDDDERKVKESFAET